MKDNISLLVYENLNCGFSSDNLVHMNNVFMSGFLTVS